MHGGMVMGVLASEGASAPTVDLTKSVDFPGVDQRLTGANALAGYSGGAFSIAAWVYIDTAAGAIFAPSGSNWVDSGVSLRFVGGSVYFRIVDPNGDYVERRGLPISTGTWVHVMGTWDGTNTAGMNVYYNNSLSNNTAAGSGPVVPMDETLDYDIGARTQSGSPAFFDGKIQQVRVAYKELDSTARAEWYARNDPTTDDEPGDGAWLVRSDDSVADAGTVNPIIGSVTFTAVNSGMTIVEAAPS